MDQKDEKILDILEENGRASYTDIAGEIEVSEGTVRNRVQRMLEENIIENFTIKTGGKRSKAVVMVQLETGRDIEKVLEDFPENVKIMEVAGEYDLVLEVEKNSNEEINSLLDEIRSIKGINNTETYMVLNERPR